MELYRLFETVWSEMGIDWTEVRADKDSELQIVWVKVLT